jgi:hypothetical protein
MCSFVATKPQRDTMPLVNAYDAGYRAGYHHDAPTTRGYDAAEFALYAMGYREGGEDREHIDDDVAALV